jgi:hypothetical protein
MTSLALDFGKGVLKKMSFLPVVMWRSLSRDLPRTSE